MEDQDVIICGAGPTGLVLACYLARYKIRTVVLEKEANIVNDPRGIVLDEDGIRILQGVGLYNKIFSEIGAG